MATESFKQKEAEAQSLRQENDVLRRKFRELAQRPFARNTDTKEEESDESPDQSVQNQPEPERKKRGAPKGHRGATRKKPEGKPDRIVFVPPEQCPKCRSHNISPCLDTEEHVCSLLDKLFRHCVPDCIHISEDMAYKEKAMISPAMCREFLMPTWKRWGDQSHRAGVPIYAVDSDGYVGELIPLWIESGFQMNDPQEVAAGNDLPAYRRKFGKRMAYSGGVDKRAMAKGGEVIEAEMRRLAPVIKAGGYIPGCDHAVPHDISWSNFIHYSRLLAKLTGWL